EKMRKTKRNDQEDSCDSGSSQSHASSGVRTPGKVMKTATYWKEKFCLLTCTWYRVFSFDERSF
ncbi:hypothetical protein CSUI_004636, partial [Cystoisospora suis]